MRLDKYLKVCRIIKRRTISKDIISFGQVKINDKVAKPATNIKVGDIISLYLGNKIITIKVINDKITNQSKEAALEMYQIIDEQVINPS